MRTVLIVPIDNQAKLLFEVLLDFRYRDQSQEFLDSPMESFDDRDAAMLSDGTKARQDVHGVAPGLLEVNAVELGSLINDQMLWLDSTGEHDSIQGCGHFPGRGPALEHGESHGSP